MISVVNAYADSATGNITFYERVGDATRKRTAKGEFASYLRTDDVTPALYRALRQSKNVTGAVKEGSWYRITWASRAAREAACDPKEGWFEKQALYTFEADVPPLRRWMADNDVSIARPRRAYFDIETCARVPLSRKEESRIIMWTLMDDAGNTKTGVLKEDTKEGERELLLELWDALQSFDQVLAWNGDRFDFPVIFARSRECGVAIDARRWLWLDHLELYRRMNSSGAESGEEKQSLALNSVATQVLHEGKAEGVGYKDIFPFWQAGGEKLQRLISYNVKDVDLMRRIEAKTGYVDLLQTLVEATGVFPDTAGIQPMPQVEAFMLRLGRQNDVHFRTRARRKDGEQEDGFAGAFVMPPTETGIVRNVHVADFSSMYPSIILSWNMSPETEAGKREREVLPAYLRHLTPKMPPIPAGHCEAPTTNILFNNEKRGLLALALEQMLALRKEWTEKKAKLPPGTPEWAEADRRSTAYKIAANSFFGVVGAPVSRLYIRSVAESITQTGVWLIRKTMEAGEARHIRSIYGDTDSVFAMGCSAEEFRAFVDHCNDVVYPELLKSQGCATNNVKLAYEKQFDRVVFVSAKRYAGRYAHYKGARASEDSRPEVKGLEYKRGDALRIARRLQAECIDALMGGGVELPPGRGLPASRSKRREECIDAPEHFVALVESYRRLIFDELLDRDDIVISKKLTKQLTEYAVKMKKDGTEGAAPPHVRIAKVLKERGEDVGEGTRISYVISEDGPIPASDYTGDCDRFSIWNDYVYPPTERLLIAAFPANDWSSFYIKRPRAPRAPKKTEGAVKPVKRKAKSSEESGALFSINASLKGGG